MVRAQTSLDPRQVMEWMPNNTYGTQAFGFKGDKAKGQTPFAEYLAKREEILPWIAEYSPYELLTADDPPVYLYYDTPPDFGKDQESPAHSANYGVGLGEKLKAVGVTWELVYPGAADVRHKDVRGYLVESLKAER